VKSILLIGFRGTGFHDSRYRNEPALIQAGHVGIVFEDHPKDIYGFHPTQLAIEQIGGEDIALEWLKENEPLEGALQLDTWIFIRAFQLSIAGARTKVWKWTIYVSDEEYNHIQKQVFHWYTQETVFIYAFPPRDQEPHPDRDNCATFPRRLGLPLPEVSGQITKYILALESIGEEWSL
jgi:hypothetical protein